MADAGGTMPWRYADAVGASLGCGELTGLPCSGVSTAAVSGCRARSAGLVFDATMPYSGVVRAVGEPLRPLASSRCISCSSNASVSPVMAWSRGLAAAGAAPAVDALLPPSCMSASIASSIARIFSKLARFAAAPSGEDLTPYTHRELTPHHNTHTHTATPHTQARTMGA